MSKLDVNKKRLLRIAAICGFIYSLVVIFGRQIYLYGSFQNAIDSPSAIALTALLVVLIAFITATALYFAFNLYLKITNEKSNFQLRNIDGKWNSSGFRLWLINWGVLFLCWIPCYLAYYPGLLSYDAPEQFTIIAGIYPATTHQPPIHTMLLEWSLNIGQMVGIEPIVLYTITQMIVFSCVIAYFTFFIQKKFIRKKWEVVILYAFFYVNPVMPLMAIQPTKDIIFTCCFIMCNIMIYNLVVRPESLKIYHYIVFTTILVITSLFRNNALYAIFAATLIAIIFIKSNRKCKLRTLSSLAIALIAVKIVTGPIYTSLDIQTTDDKVEMSAVPVEQLALVFVEAGGDFTAEDWQEITYYIYDPSILVTRYNPRFYDYMKDAIYKSNMQADYSGFLKMWFSIGKQYPIKYVRAFLNLNIPYWYPFADTIDPYANRVYIETNIGECPYQFERDSKIPWLLNIYEGFANYSYLDKPVIRILFSINTPIWLMLLGIVLLIVKRSYKKIVIFMPALLLWCTYLLGPVSNFRYIYPIFVLYPFILALILQNESNND